MYNKLLLRQIQKNFGVPDDIPENLVNLFKVISDSYDHYEKDRKMIERSIELSSKEMIELNTELKKEKEELKKAHKELKTLFEDINEILYTIDMVSNKLIHISPVCEKIYGYTPAEFHLDNDLWHKVIYPEDKHIAAQVVQSLYQGKPVLNEYRIIHKDGSIRWIENKIIPALDSDGQLIRINGVTSDVTGRKQAEKELEASFSLLEATIESTADGILVVDFNGKIVRFNKKFTELWRIPQQILNQQDDEKAIAFVLDQLTNPEEFLSKVKELYVNQKDVSFDILRFKDGRTFERYSQPQLINGNCVGRVWNFRDITVRKQAEDKLVITSSELQKALGDINKIMDSSLDVICAVDEEGYFIQVSAACEAIWGYKADELIGKLMIDFVYPEDREQTQKASGNVMAGNNMINFENRYIRKDGSLVPVNWSARWDPKDRIRYGVARDATEKKRSEEALESQRKRYNDLFLQAPSCIGVVRGPNHVYEMANPLYLQLIGKRDIIGKSVREAVPEVVEQGFIEILDEVYKTGNPFSASEMPVTLEEDNGQFSDVYLNFVCQPYRNNEGNVDGIFFFAINVTEQVLSRKKIEESELRYRSLVEQATDAICITDASMKFLDINPYGLDMFGYNLEEALQLALPDILFADDLAANPIRLNELKLGKTIRNERRLKRKDGTAVDMAVSTKLMEDGRLIMFGHDITERKKTEEALKESEKRLRQIIDLVPHFIFAKDAKGKFILANEAVARVYGCTVEDLIGKTDADFNSEKEEADHFMKEDLEVINSGIAKNNIEETITDIAGNIRVLSTTKIPYSYTGGNTLSGILGVSVDITDNKKAETVLKENEGQLSIAAQIAKLGYWEFDALKGIFTFNDQFYDIFKTTAEKVGGYQMTPDRYAELFLYPEDRGIVGKEMGDAIMSDDASFRRNLEHRIIYATGEIGFISVNFYIVKDEEGRTIKTYGANQDITDRKKGEETLRRSEVNLELKNKELELKNKELEQFAYVASHDLQEPLRTTSSFAELLQQQYQGKLDAKADKYLTFITQSSERMKVLIKDLLDYSRIGRKKEREVVDCNFIVQQVLADLDLAIKETKADINVESLPVFDGYPSEIKQLFQNLIINAIKFRKKNTGLQIKISAVKNNGNWEFICNDNGIGIEKEHSERIFIIFQRLHTRSEYEGSGIGLAHCKKIVELHGGEIWVNSAAGNGSTFHFTIPAKNN